MEHGKLARVLITAFVVTTAAAGSSCCDWLDQALGRKPGGKEARLVSAPECCPPWYVSETTGSDATGLGRPESPWATIQHAVDQAAPGDEIRVAEGLYNGVDLNKPLTLKGGFDPDSWKRNLTAFHSVIDGGSFNPGVSSILVNGSGLDGFVVRNSGFGVFNISSDMIISNNIITDNYFAVVAYSVPYGGYENATTTMSHNLIFNNYLGVYAISLSYYYYSQCYYSYTNVYSTNDTIAGNYYYGVLSYGYAFGATCSPNPPAAVIRNSIITDTVYTPDVVIPDWTNSSVDYSCVPDGSASGNGANIVTAHPSFFEPSRPDHMLMPGDPCINSGDPAIKDPDGSRSDIGFTGGRSPFFDKDHDGMPNPWENLFGFDRSLPSDGGLDSDSDGLLNREEYTRWTDPRNPDTDGDNMPDGWEDMYSLCGLDPLVDDASGNPDADPYDNLTEYQNGTDPCVADP